MDNNKEYMIIRIDNITREQEIALENCVEGNELEWFCRLFDDERDYDMGVMKMDNYKHHSFENKTTCDRCGKIVDKDKYVGTPDYKLCRDCFDILQETE